MEPNPTRESRQQLLRVIEEYEAIFSNYVIVDEMNLAAIQEGSDLLEIAHMRYWCDWEKFEPTFDLKSMPSIRHHYEMVVRRYNAMKSCLRNRMLMLGAQMVPLIEEPLEQPIMLQNPEVPVAIPEPEPLVIVEDLVPLVAELVPDIIEPNNNVQNERIVVVEQNENVQNVRIITCHYCGHEGHRMHRCPDFLRLWMDERVDRVREMRLCANCFMMNRNGRHRCAYGKCHRCDGNVFHNSLLCPNRSPFT